MKVGIHAASFYVPQLYLSIRDLAIARNIDPDKLEKGLGLSKMALIDTDEDTATLAANALLRIFEDYDVDPKEIARIYLGTESALDASKPTAIYATQMVEEQLAPKYGERCFANTDITDITFACVGAVDALQNSLDFIRLNPDKKAIVIAADFAKYALNSSGEYTQGSGAVALLISSNPSLLSLETEFGVATQSVFDFFKPRRKMKTSGEVQKSLNTENAELEIHMDEPIFDGQFSNECYKARIREAYKHLKKQLNRSDRLFSDWHFLIFHLPYAFQGKRMFMEIFALENKEWAEGVLGKKIEEESLTNEDLKFISKTDVYKDFVKNTIEPGQVASSEVGNIYTASIFLSFMSALFISLQNNVELAGKKVGFLSYGSGSKAKVFQGEIAPDWKDIVLKWNLFERLENRVAINFETYQKLHKKFLTEPIEKGKEKFVLHGIEEEKTEQLGARYYRFLD